MRIESVVAATAVVVALGTGCKDEPAGGAAAIAASASASAAAAASALAAAAASASAAAAKAAEKPHERTVLAKVAKPKGLALDASGRVLVLSVTGGDPKTNTESMDLLALSAQAPGEPTKIGGKLRQPDGPVVVKGDAYVTVSGDKPTDDKLVKIATAGGGAPVTVAKAWAGGEPGIAADGAGGLVYFAAPAKPDDKNLDVMHLAAGKPTATKIATANVSAKLTFLVADATNAYWPEAGKIVKAPIAGGAPTEIAKVVYAWSAASDGSFLYFADSPGESEGTLKRVPIAGGATQTLASGFTFPIAMALDAKSVYFLDLNQVEGSVLRVAKEGGAAATLVEHQEHPKRLAVDDKFVYWTNTGEGVVARAAK